MSVRPYSPAEDEYLLERYSETLKPAAKKQLAEKLYRTPEEIDKRYTHLSRQRKALRPQNLIGQGINKPNMQMRNMGAYMAEKDRAPRSLSESYTVTNKAWRVIGGKRHYYRSLWEQNIACYLEILKKAGQVKKWEYEPDTFWFHQISRGIRSYTPDFKVWLPDGTLWYWEVKGIMDSKSKTKIKRMKKYYPDIRLRLIRQRDYNQIKKNAHFIPGWRFNSKPLISK